MPRSFLIQKKRAGRRARGDENAVMQNVETGEKDATTTTYLPHDAERVPLPAKRVLLPVLDSSPDSSSPTAVNPLREPGHYTDMEPIDKRYEGYTYNPYARFAPYFNAHHPLFGYAYMGLPLIDLSNPSHLSHLSHLSHPSHPSHIYQYAPKLDHSSPANRYHPYHRHSNSPDREVEVEKTTGNDVITGRSSPASALSPVESGLDRNDNLSAPGVFRQTRYGSHETLQSSSADDSGYKTSYSPISSASSSPVIPNLTTDTTDRDSLEDTIEASDKEEVMKDVTKDSDRRNVMGEVCVESDVDVDSDEDVDPVREDYIAEECSYDCKGHVKEQVNDEFVIKEAEIQTDFEIQQRLGSNVRKTLFEGDTTADRKDEFSKENHYQSPASVSPSVQDSARWRKGHIENILKPSDPVSEKPTLRDHHFWVNNVPNFSRGVYAGGKDMKAPLSPYPLYPVGSVTRPVASPGYGHTTGEVPHPHGAGISGVEERGYGIRESSEGPVYVCRECGKSYSTYSGLAKHKQFHCASVLKKEFSCKHCTKTYTSLGALKMHIRTHTLPCKCQLCGKAFSRPWLLQGHIRTHTGEKPFSCPHCQRSFADRSNLRAHLQTHSDIKKYSCKACAKTFSRMSLLLKHEDGGCAAVP